MAEETQSVASPPGGKRIPTKFIAIISLSAMSFISFSSLILVFFGMLPTLVAYLIDRSHLRSNTFCVGGMNFCGVFPYLLELWFKSHSINGAMVILTDMFSIAVMYFAAAFGWLMFIAIPPVVASVLSVVEQRQVVSLRAQQKKILEEWGKAVAANVKESVVLKESKPAATAEPATQQTDKSPPAGDGQNAAAATTPPQQVPTA